MRVVPRPATVRREPADPHGDGCRQQNHAARGRALTAAEIATAEDLDRSEARRGPRRSPPSTGRSRRSTGPSRPPSAIAHWARNAIDQLHPGAAGQEKVEALARSVEDAP